MDQCVLTAVRRPTYRCIIRAVYVYVSRACDLNNFRSNNDILRRRRKPIRFRGENQYETAIKYAERISKEPNKTQPRRISFLFYFRRRFGTTAWSSRNAVC